MVAHRDQSSNSLRRRVPHLREFQIPLALNQKASHNFRQYFILNGSQVVDNIIILISIHPPFQILQSFHIFGSNRIQYFQPTDSEIVPLLNVVDWYLKDGVEVRAKEIIRWFTEFVESLVADLRIIFNLDVLVKEFENLIPEEGFSDDWLEED